MSSISAVVITYRPGPVVVENIRRLSEQIEKIVVVDNGSQGQSLPVLEALGKLPGVELIRNASNLGIATALNMGIRRALEGGAEWVATFDQDSAVTRDYFKEMLHAYEQCPDKTGVGLITPRGWSMAFTKVLHPGQQVWAYAEAAVSSGSLIKSEVFRKAGFYDDELFIDFVDLDFCLRMRQCGYKILRALTVVLDHELGSEQTRNLLGYKISFREHIPWRHYYMMRNRLLLHRRYFLSSPRWSLFDFLIFCRSSTQIVVETRRREKIQAMLKGFWDGVRGKSGRHPAYPPDPKS